MTACESDFWRREELVRRGRTKEDLGLPLLLSRGELRRSGSIDSCLVTVCVYTHIQNFIVTLLQYLNIIYSCIINQILIISIIII